MRRAEICALTADDIQGNVISVTKAYALDRGRWIIKPPKTTGSERTVLVSDQLAGMLPKEGCVIGINPGQVSCRFQRAVKNSGMDRHFTFHSLRHYHATMMHTAGVSDITIQSEHGWTSPSTMKTIYWGNIESEKRRQMDIYNDSVSEILKKSECI